MNNGCAPIEPPPALPFGKLQSHCYLAPEQEIDSESVQLLITSNSADQPRSILDVSGRLHRWNHAERCNIAFCGDGEVQEGEECDDGDEDEENGCNSDCILNICGDGVVHRGVEDCDDGNENNQDDCLNSCEQASCGRRFLMEGVEVCDDGDDDNTD